MRNNVVYFRVMTTMKSQKKRVSERYNCAKHDDVIFCHTDDDVTKTMNLNEIRVSSAQQKWRRHKDGAVTRTTKLKKMRPCSAQ